MMQFADADLVAGTEEPRRRAREDLRRQQRLHFAESSTWPRVDLADLRFGHHLVENKRTGETYRRYQGEMLDAMHTPIVAWSITPNGPIFLESAR